MKVRMQTLPKAGVEVFITTLQKALASITTNKVYTSPTYTPFHSASPPTIPINEYITRIVQYAPCTSESFVISLIYLHRITDTIGTFIINPSTIHRLLITSLLIAGKYTDDIYYNNKYYAQLGGIPCQEMNTLEVAMFSALQYQCHVTTEEYQRFAFILDAPKPKPKPTPKPTPPPRHSIPHTTTTHTTSTTAHTITTNTHQTTSTPALPTYTSTITTTATEAAVGAGAKYVRSFSDLEQHKCAMRVPRHQIVNYFDLYCF